MKCSLGISNFLEEISSLSHYTVLLYFFALITEEGFLFSPCFLWNSAFKLIYLSFSPSICKASLDKHFAILYFFFLGVVLIPASCTMSWISGCSSSGTLCIRSNPWIYFSLLLYNCKLFDLGHIWKVLLVFPIFFNLSLNLAIRCSWSEPQSAPGLFFPHWLYRHSPSLFVKNKINLISVLSIQWCPCIVFSCVVGKGCLLWPMHSLGKTLLAIALLHSILQGQICLLLEVSLDFLILHCHSL